MQLIHFGLTENSSHQIGEFLIFHIRKKKHGSFKDLQDQAFVIIFRFTVGVLLTAFMFQNIQKGTLIF